MIEDSDTDNAYSVDNELHCKVLVGSVSVQRAERQKRCGVTFWEVTLRNAIAQKALRRIH